MKHYILFILSSILIIGCQKANERTCLKGNGEYSSIEIENDNSINEIDLFDDVNLILINDSLNFVSINGPINLLDFIDLKIESNKISIKNLNKCDFLRNKKEIDIYFHYTQLKEVNLYGYGNLSNNDTLKHNITVNANNAFSNITLIMNSDSVAFYLLKGSTSLMLSGYCNYLYGYNSGIAPFNSSLLATKKVHIQSNTISRTDVHVNEKLIGEIRSYGNLYYTGNPLSTNYFITGDGKIIHL